MAKKAVTTFSGTHPPPERGTTNFFHLPNVLKFHFSTPDQIFVLAFFSKFAIHSGIGQKC